MIINVQKIIYVMDYQTKNQRIQIIYVTDYQTKNQKNHALQQRDKIIISKRNPDP